MPRKWTKLGAPSSAKKKKKKKRDRLRVEKFKRAFQRHRNMLPVARAARGVRGARIPLRAAFRSVRSVRFAFASSEPAEIVTKLSDTEDPQRNAFFQYTWGLWMQNDAAERKRRETRFSIEGVTKALQEMASLALADVKAPTALSDGTVALTHNLHLLGHTKGPLLVTLIASVHEGKHHRVYKESLLTGRSVVLRIPYPLEQQYSTALRIKSEVATMDFMHLKLGARVPRVLAYGYDRDNALRAPFIVMEHVEGDLLMRQWEPLAPGDLSDAATKAKLMRTIEPVADFHAKLLEVTFAQSGSLYFYNDVSPAQQAMAAYDGEDADALAGRWRVGPTTEHIYHRHKLMLTKNHLLPHLGPWPAAEPLKVVESVAAVQLEEWRQRLALMEAGSSRVVEDTELLKRCIKTYRHLQAMLTKLLNPQLPLIVNAAELFKPRLFAPDLDPLNVIVTPEGEHVFVDFEATCIKPFALSLHPPFVAYQGAKVHDLHEDVPGYSEMDEVEQQQYQFMHCKTRNERLWEMSLNERRHDLIAVALPHLKLLKSPYVQAVELKNDKDYLYVEGLIVQLQTMWDTYVANGLVNTTDTAFPVEYTAEFLDEFQLDLETYQMEAVATPFAATGGWVPQDMFDTLRLQGIIVEDGRGNYRIEADKALE